MARYFAIIDSLRGLKDVMSRVYINRIICFSLLVQATLCIGAETRTWSLVDGSNIEAEYIIIMGGKANLRLPSGKTVKISMDQLSQEDRTHLELENPPEFKIEFVRDRNQKVFDLMAGQADYTLRPPEYRCHYGVKLKQRDTFAYKHELHFEFFALGQERAGSGLILLTRQETEPFLLTRDNEWTYKFMSNKEVILQNYLYGDGPSNGHQKRGRKYYGYLILLKDVRGKTIAVETSHDWLLEHLENLKERYVGNYMDKTCSRIFPTRPYNKVLGK